VIACVRTRRLCGGPAQQRSERTRRDLLDAARETFTRRGFAEASMEEIAERAGVTRGPLGGGPRIRIRLDRT
jgi:AcrR family transcriptional regulator